MSQGEIKSKISNADEGSIIIFQEGDYEKDLVVDINKKNIRIRSERATLHGDSKINIKAPNIVVEGFTFTPKGSINAVSRNSEPLSENSKILNNKFIGEGKETYAKRIRVAQSSFHEKWEINILIEGNTFEDILGEGNSNIFYTITRSTINALMGLLPQSIVEKLENRMLNKTIKKEAKFIQRLKRVIGEEQTNRHKNTILQHTDQEERRPKGGELISVKAGSVMVRNNTFKKCRGFLSLRGGERNHAEDNTFTESIVPSGIQVYGSQNVILNNGLENSQILRIGAGRSNMPAGEQPAGQHLAAHHARVEANGQARIIINFMFPKFSFKAMGVNRRHVEQMNPGATVVDRSE